MGIFSRKKKEDKTAADPVWQENPLFEQEEPQRISTVNVPIAIYTMNCRLLKKEAADFLKRIQISIMKFLTVWFAC